MAEAHSRIAPSSAPRYVYCHGSVAMEAQFPETEQSQEAKEGEAAHHVGATILRDLVQFRQARRVPAGTLAPNGIVVTDEMIEAADLFTNYVADKCGNDAYAALHIEEVVSAPALHPELWGRPDVWWAAMGATGAYVYVADFKFGHRFVDAFENWQLIAYLAGILSRPEFAGIDRARIEVCAAIVQPRNYHPSGAVREWTTTADKLAPLFATLSEACHAATGSNPMCHVNDECRDCRGRHACTTLQQGADAAMDFAGVMNAAILPPNALGAELRMIHRAQMMLDARATGLEEQAISTIRMGQRVPFYGMGQGQAREIWTAKPEEVFAMGDAMGLDLRKPAAALTPNQARTAGKSVPGFADLIKAYSDRPPGAVKLETVDNDTARKVFG